MEKRHSTRFVQEDLLSSVIGFFIYQSSLSDSSSAGYQYIINIDLVGLHLPL
jgi:hypothetical protein